MSSTQAPLPAAAIHILVAIGPGVRHGYSIMTEVADLTEGAVRLAPGTLYTNIKRLLEAGLIEEVDATTGSEGEGARRRYYRLTTSGRRVVKDEVARMSALIDRARSWAGESPG